MRNKKSHNAKLEEILRGRGAAQAGLVRENVTEIRSCGVMDPGDDDDDDDDPDDPPGGGKGEGKGKDGDKGKKGDAKGKKDDKGKGKPGHRCRWRLMIIWEFAVQHAEVDNFHATLERIEPVLAARLGFLDPTALYLGTFILNAGGTPRYRTVWGYRSQRAMVDVWAAALARDKPLVDAAKELRQFWLADPDRTEGRWSSAHRALFTAEASPFARLTIDAAKARRR